MGLIVTYHPGGFQPAAPAQNKAEQLDTATGYTRWNPAGTEVEQRPLTAAESATLVAHDASMTVSVNGDNLRGKAKDALAANANYLALANPTNAQTLAQVKALTRQTNALLRLQLNDLGDVSDT